MRYHIPIAILLLLFSSCKKENKENLNRLVSEWQGKEILFPKNVAFTRFVADSTNVYNFSLDTVNYPPRSDCKVLIYVDSAGCTECKLMLSKWKEFMARADSLAAEKIPLLFFFQSGDIEKIYYLFQADYLDYPACIDANDELNGLNLFPPQEAFHTFLLDRDNKVVAIGNPLLSSGIMELYLKQIKEISRGKSSV